jgi:hypothetical protein
MDDPEGVINDKVSAAKQVNLVLSTATFQDVAIFTYIEN